jgi:hypothetical protein
VDAAIPKTNPGPAPLWPAFNPVYGEETIDLALVGAVAPGAHVLTHLGVAMRMLEAGEAAAICNALEADARGCGRLQGLRGRTLRSNQSPPSLSVHCVL